MKTFPFFLMSLILCASLCAQEASRTAFVSSNLPIVVIDTHGVPIVDEPKIPADMGIIDNGNGMRNALTDPFNNYNGRIAIEIRGSSSQMFPKKQYGLTTTTASGDDNDVSLLGFPSEHTWILSAPYTDKSLMRDPLTYILSNAIGHYASRTKYCELFLNEGGGLDYKGVYILMEKIKRDKNRVNISKMTAADTSGDNLTGGYIFKIDKADKATDRGWDATFPPFATAARRYLMYQYDYPDPDEITPQQMAYIKGYEKYFETVMHSSAFNDPMIGYPKLLDVPSFVDMVVINELSKNVDGYRLSTFLYKDRTSKNDRLFAGPYWDYNLGYGNCNYGDAFLFPGWELDYQAAASGDSYAAPFWWGKLWSDQAFKKAVAQRWAQLRTGPLATSSIFHLIDSLANVVNEAQQRNYERWPIIGVYIWPNYYYQSSTYLDEVNWMKGWILNRTVWLDKTFAPLATTVCDARVTVPTQTTLIGNYPNPFNPATTIAYVLSDARHVRLTVSDMLGRTIQTLVDGDEAPGRHVAEWNAASVTSGIYICRLSAGATNASLRMAVVK